MIVYVTYAGTVGAGYDQTGVFGPANSSLTGDSYTATYIFDTSIGRTYSSSTWNYALGGYGTATFQPSPSLGAVLTINGHSVAIGGMDAGEISGVDFGPTDGSRSTTYVQAADDFFYNANSYLYNNVVNLFAGSDPTLLSSITTPYTYSTATGSDPGSGGFTIETYSNGGILIYANGTLDPTTVTLSTSPVPVMLDAVSAKHDLTTLSGTALPTSNVSVFDGTKLVGTVTAASDGTWSLQTKLMGNGVHSFTETSTYLVANPQGAPSLGTEKTASTDTASSAGVTLYSTSSNKSLAAGGGADVLIGAPGDKLTGGAGADTFVFNPKFGKETITNFNANQDVLALDHNLFANPTASQVLSQTHDTKAGAVIKVDAHDTITLIGVTVAQLQSHLSDFHFF